MATKSAIDSAAEIGSAAGESRDQVFRYIRLNLLIPELLDMVDEGRIAFRPAVELSHLQEQEQYDLLTTIESEDATPSLSQSIRMKRLSQEGKLDMVGILAHYSPGIQYGITTNFHTVTEHSTKLFQTCFNILFS